MFQRYERFFIDLKYQFVSPTNNTQNKTKYQFYLTKKLTILASYEFRTEIRPRLKTEAIMALLELDSSIYEVSLKYIIYQKKVISTIPLKMY